MGRLEEVSFKEGVYIYIGSAKGCLEARLQRHLRKEKRIFWHIDYLLENKKAKIFCQDPTTEIIKKGFGSSDCKCLTHLFFIKDKKKTEKILKETGFSVHYSFLKFKIGNLLL